MQCNFGNTWRVTDVTFRFGGFVAMIRLNRWPGDWSGNGSAKRAQTEPGVAGADLGSRPVGAAFRGDCAGTKRQQWWSGSDRRALQAAYRRIARRATRFVAGAVSRGLDESFGRGRHTGSG